MEKVNKEINCEICDNRGFYVAESEEFGSKYIFSKECSCAPKRAYLARAKKLGLGDDIFNKSFDNFEVQDNWQSHMKERALAFINQNEHKAFYIGGQVGAGKTHICTALLNNYLNKNMTCNYVIWNTVTTKLKQTAYEDKAAYYNLMNELINTEVLYIDDFFKTLQSKADIDNAFEIINARYLKSKTEDIKTFISSEKTIKELAEIDQAIASRIFEVAGKGDFVISILKDPAKNYRFRK